MYWNNYFNRSVLLRCLTLLIAARACAQQVSSDTLQKILDRLDALEQQNQALLTEVQALRQEVKSNTPAAAADTQPLADQVQVNTERIKEQAATKVEASQRFPISITGMFLFDSFLGTPDGSAPALSTYSPYGSNGSGGGATLRQSILGFDFRGPQLPGGGKVNGSLSLDFYAQAGENDVLRIRRGVVSFDWTRRSITVGQDKPLIAPLEPTSFARVAIPPLAGAGNLWLWRPQIRYEERVPFSANTQAAFQVGVLQTDESYSAPFLPANSYFAASRPAVEARAEFRHQWDEQSRLAVGFGFHESSSHILGQSAKSQVVSADILYKPFSKLELSGTIFRGQNFANLGGEPPGVTVTSQGVVIPIRGSAGWMQIALPVTNRLTFDFYAGRQLNNPRDLNEYGISRTFTYAGNVLYRLAPNVIIGFEASRFDAEYLNAHQLFANRYDATAAYLF